jgi:peptidylprolyl isomerase
VNLKNKTAITFATPAVEPGSLFHQPPTANSHRTAITPPRLCFASITDRHLDATQETIVLEGAETTASGLQFLEVTPGDGAAPQEGDILTLNFTASLPDGTEFANTAQEYGKPVTIVFLQNQILPGMDEGLALMKVGGTAKMVLPPELAFGAEGYGMVPGNSQVILDVELVSAEEPPQPTSVAASELTTTESGLQYADLKPGEGETVEAGDIVSTNYTLWVQGEDEANYITSSNGNEPLTFTQGAGDTVFPGWEEGMLGMQVGGKRLLVIPPELGFGEAGSGTIPPGATLVMEVELSNSRNRQSYPGYPKTSSLPPRQPVTTS